MALPEHDHVARTPADSLSGVPWRAVCTTLGIEWVGVAIRKVLQGV